jgi:hypothetical protein
MRVAGSRMRWLQIGAVCLIPIAGVALALTFRSTESDPPLRVRAQTGSYVATVGKPLSVTAFRIANTSKTTVTIKRVRVAQSVPGLDVIGALAYRGCNACVSDSAVPPNVTPPSDGPAPRLVGVSRFELKPGASLTLLLSVRLSRQERVHVPPLRIDLTGASGARTLVTAPGPELCAGKGC